MTFGNPSLPQSVLGFYRGWALQQRQHDLVDGLFVVIDDLAETEIPPTNFADLSSVQTLGQILLSRAQSGTESLGPFSRYSVDKLKQSLVFLKQGGQAVRCQSSVEIRGTPWIPVSDETIEGLRIKMTSDKSEIGESGVFSRFLETGVVAERIAEISREWLEKLFHRFPFLLGFDFVTKYIESDRSWANIVTYDDPHFVLLVNQKHNFTEAVVHFLALHEICGHMVHLNQLAKNRELQVSSPHLLAIAVHTQDALLAEGIAQFLAALLVYRIDPSDVLARAAFREKELAHAITQKNIIAIMEGKLDCEGAAKYHETYLGGIREKLVARYQKISGDPLFCCQIMNYHSGFELLRPALGFADEILAVFLKELLNGFYSFAELRDLVSKYAQA